MIAEQQIRQLERQIIISDDLMIIIMMMELCAMCTK